MITENLCIQSTARPPSFTSTRNACKLCAPLGACLAFRGIEGAVPFLHGSQGCSTYIRRYMISHFKEPMDVACSNFGETTAIFGGKENLRVGLVNVIQQYQPSLIGIATTCLAETIGDDVSMFLHEIRPKLEAIDSTCVVHVSTPSYAGSHDEGYRAAVRALVDQLAEASPPTDQINLFPGMVSPADLRYLKRLFMDFGIDVSCIPDYSDTLDGPVWEEYHRVPEGGTPIDRVQSSGSARASIELGGTCRPELSAAALLEERFRVPKHQIPLPIGVCLTDKLMETLEAVTGRPLPKEHAAERGRLIDAIVDAHKYVVGKRAVVYGEPDLVAGLAGMLAEIGVMPVLCATGSDTSKLAAQVAAVAPDMADDITVLENVDFLGIEDRCKALDVDLIVGNSKGFKLSKSIGVPLVRVGFPIHDRIGGARVLHLGYRGAQQLFDRITNALIEANQNASSVGYTYM